MESKKRNEVERNICEKLDELKEDRLRSYIRDADIDVLKKKSPIEKAYLKEEATIRLQCFLKLKEMLKEIKHNHRNSLFEAIMAFLGQEYIKEEFIIEDVGYSIELSDYMQTDVAAVTALKDIVYNAEERHQRMLVKESIDEREMDIEEENNEE